MSKLSHATFYKGALLSNNMAEASLGRQPQGDYVRRSRKHLVTYI
jgi:hypothetical protein